VSFLTITNARVFDGERLSEPRSVRIVDGLIADDVADADSPAEIFHAEGAALLPGLMDGHVHVDDPQQASTLAYWGVTTAFDMGAKNPQIIAGIRHTPGVTTLQSAGFPAGPPTGTHIARLGYPSSTGITDADDAAGWVASRVAEGSDYIKVLLEPRIPFQPGPLDQRTVSALVRAAHAAGRLVIVHTTTAATAQAASAAGADAVTHTPLVGEFDEAFARELVAAGTVAIPTLSMMQAIATDWPFPVRPPGVDFEHAIASVGVLHRAGVTIVAGTDANADPATPARVPHGESLHAELALMVRAGLSPAGALRAATSAPAAFFGMADRGAIAPHLRADLLLVDGDPTTDIAATRRIRGVWIAGERVR
jgi:imidazolonepropionase-like amidohydrolase